MSRPADHIDKVTGEHKTAEVTVLFRIGARVGDLTRRLRFARQALQQIRATQNLTNAHNIADYALDITEDTTEDP
jgi:hypothetical protein